MNTELEKQLEALIGEIKNKEDFEKVKVQLLKRGIESLLKAEMTAYLGFGLELEFQTLPPDKLNLTKKEKTDIINFMKSLTDPLNSL